MFFKRFYNFTHLCLVAVMLLGFTTSAHAETIELNSLPGDGQIRTPENINWNNVYTATEGDEIYTDIGSITPQSRKGGGERKNVVRGFLSFDTTMIPEESNITDVYLQTFVVGKRDDVNNQYAYVAVYQGFNESTSTLYATDVNKCGDSIINPTAGSQKIDITNVPVLDFIEFDFLPSAYSWIDKGGFTKLCLREGHDAEGVEYDPAGNYVHNDIGIRSADWFDLEEHPTLVIQYELPNASSEVSELRQLRAGGNTSIETGEEFVGNAVVLSGEIGPDDGGVLRGLEVEVERVDEEFDGLGTYVSDLGTATTALVTVKSEDLFSVSDLYGGDNADSFKWRARAIDENGNSSDWVEFGDNGADADFTMNAVPLVTQTASPFPSLFDTQGWQDSLYAGGRASSTGDCGLSIRECGCVLSSLSTLAYHHGVTEGIDGSVVNPENLNDWLLGNNGFTRDGSILWPEAMKYFGTQISEDVSKTQFSLEGHNVSDKTRIASWLDSESPVVAYGTPQGYRHYFVVDSLLDTGYEMSDPFWFNTLHSDQDRDYLENIQDYNDSYTAAQLIDVNDEAVAFESMVEIHLASPAELVVTDPQGRRVGHNPRRGGRDYDEIPGGQYDHETSLYSGNEIRTDEAHERKVVRIFGAEEGKYDVRVIGTDSGEYLLSIYTIDEFGESTLEEYAGKTKKNKKTKYKFEFGVDDGDEDDDRGHGNDDDKCDEDNPGKKKQCKDEDDDDDGDERDYRKKVKAKNSEDED